MKMNEAQLKKTKDFLKKKLEKSKCPLCGHSDWNFHENIFELGEYKSGLGLGTGNSVFPVIILICSNCKHSAFLSAILTGVVDPK